MKGPSRQPPSSSPHTAIPSEEATPPQASGQPPRDDIEAALSRFVEAEAGSSPVPVVSPAPSMSPEPEPQPTVSAPRVARLTDARAALAAAALVALLLNVAGLLAWARRLEPGPIQGAWLAVLEPLHGAIDAIGLGSPKRALEGGLEAAARWMGEGEDPIFARAWRAAETAAADPAGETAAELASPGGGDRPLPVEAESTGASGSEATEAPPQPVEAVGAPAGDTSPVSSQTSVLLLGDSLIAGSLGSMLARSLEAGPGEGYRVSRAFQLGTGLSQPVVFNWVRVASEWMARERPAFVICSLGANDAQPIRVGEKVLEFGEPAWQRVYASRVRALMRTLSDGGRVRVLWLGLPPMRSQRMSERARLMNRLFAASARQTPGVEYLEVQMLLVGADGRYAAFARDDDGRYARLRMDDGVHYSPAGARAVARWVLDWIAERERQTRRSEGRR